MKNVNLHHGSATDIGLVRKVNEDSYLVAPPVFVVADGMGGHSGGDVASQMVVEEFQRMAEVYDPARGAEHVAELLRIDDVATGLVEQTRNGVHDALGVATGQREDELMFRQHDKDCRDGA